MTDQKIISDSELIHLVKDKNDSKALEELTNRHSGIYVKIVQQYSGSNNKIQVEDVKDDKQYNIYKWIISYKEDKNMKLGTYIGQMTKYMCLDLLTNTPNQIEITETNTPILNQKIEDNAEDNDSISLLQERAKRISDVRFWPIVKMRHFSGKAKTWREIGKSIGITHECARQVYNRHIEKVKNCIK